MWWAGIVAVVLPRRVLVQGTFRPALLALLLKYCAASIPTTSGPGATGDEKNDIVAQFVSLQRTKAADAYFELYGDGLGLDGEAAPPLESFVENYIVEALNRETKRILKEKGYGEEPTSEEKDMRNVEKKDAPTTLEGEVERLVVQKRQRRAVRERVWADKRSAYWELQGKDSVQIDIPCAEPMYQGHVYESVKGCSPGSSEGCLPCGRFIMEGFATRSEQEQMISVMDHSFQGLFHQGDETLLVPDTDSRDRMGAAGFQLTGQLLERARITIASRLNISRLYYSGSLLKRMDHPFLDDGMQIDQNHDSANPHVDKANIASYDWSALLYLNSVGEDFVGGELAFHDTDEDRIVRPLAGRLVAFSSGLENLHRVLPMQWGKRYVLSMWFTCSQRHAHQRLGLSATAAAQPSSTIDQRSEL